MNEIASLLAMTISKILAPIVTVTPQYVLERLRIEALECIGARSKSG